MDRHAPRLARLTLTTASIGLLLAAATVLAHWAFVEPATTSSRARVSPALAAALLGIGAGFLVPGSTPRGRRARVVLGALVAAVGGLALAASWLGAELWPERLFAREQRSPCAARMPALGAFALVLAGVALAACGGSTRCGTAFARAASVTLLATAGAALAQAIAAGPAPLAPLAAAALGLAGAGLAALIDAERGGSSLFFAGPAARRYRRVVAWILVCGFAIDVAALGSSAPAAAPLVAAGVLVPLHALILATSVYLPAGDLARALARAAIRLEAIAVRAGPRTASIAPIAAWRPDAPSRRKAPDRTATPTPARTPAIAPQDRGAL